MTNPLTNFLSRLVSPLVKQTIRETLAVSENDNTFSRSPKGDEVPGAKRRGCMINQGVI
jgi:hypothetical protein